jgi:multiple sugar transport system substrate-binding protein
MYNKSILKNAGLLDANGKLNFKDDYAGFTGALQAIKKSNPNITPLTMTMKPPQLVLMWLSFYYQMGGENVVDLKAKKADFDDAKATEALSKLHELYANYVPEKLTDPAGMDMFKAKKAAFYIDGTWNVYAAAKPLGDDFGVVGFPHLFGNTEVTTNQSIILPKKDSRTDAQTKAALEFVKWFADNNWKWALAGHVPAYQPSLETKEFKSLPYQPSYADPSRKLVALPVLPGTMLHTAPEVTDQVQLAVLGSTSPSAAVSTIRKNLDKLIPQLVP